MWDLAGIWHGSTSLLASGETWGILSLTGGAIKDKCHLCLGLEQNLPKSHTTESANTEQGQVLQASSETSNLTLLST